MGLRPLQSSSPILLGRTPPDRGYAAGRGCATTPTEAAAAVARAGAARDTAAPTTRAESMGSRRACRSVRIPTSSFGRPDVISAVRRPALGYFRRRGLGCADETLAHRVPKSSDRRRGGQATKLTAAPARPAAPGKGPNARLPISPRAL